ncbi:hypothetical protein SUDANB121_00054 [Nocardiopsis dassonvillei]|uniref:hypothetical protein n=1 Tax=Nocardiopsis dassonvillei TaxID=2014 RepID=UPI003F553C8F
MISPVPGTPFSEATESPVAAAPIDPHEHTMGAASLLRYLQIKTHHLVQERDWESIRVMGGYDRDCVVSTNEKSDKLFNWQRPTAQVDGDALVIRCFPGHDYVQHYGLILATYLAMADRRHDHITYAFPHPAACRSAVDRVDLDVDGALVVVGWGLEHLAPGRTGWTYGHGYAWQSASVHGRRVVYLGFLHSIWGDVAGRVVARLAALGARDVVYVGKVGALDPSVVPNTALATGSVSLVEGTPVAWRDFFGPTAVSQPEVRTGVHVTSPSVLLEGNRWLAANAQHAFVDPEIGPMGQAAAAAGIGFGYLHVISNNLARRYPEDLSNERLLQVLRQRADLVTRIRRIIEMRLASDPT